MFQVLHQRGAPLADLARVLAGWLVVILLLQAQAALLTLVRGPAHRHLAALPAAGAEWRGGSGGEPGASAHDLAHARGEAHHHAAGHLTLPADAEAALDAAALVLLAVLLPLPGGLYWPARSVRQALAVVPGWYFGDRSTAPPRRPPRG